jgi:hypothetical protein
MCAVGADPDRRDAAEFLVGRGKLDAAAELDLAETAS